jgi:hypothetical protein
VLKIMLRVLVLMLLADVVLMTLAIQKLTA